MLFDADGPALTTMLRTFPESRLIALLTAPTERQLVDAIDGGIAAMLMATKGPLRRLP